MATAQEPAPADVQTPPTPQQEPATATPPIPVAGATTPDNREIVLLVHGTFAYHENDDADGDGTRWWQWNSKFAKQLQHCLGPDYLVSAASDPDPDNEHAHKRIFHWSGLNSEASRRDAGRLLDLELQKLEANNRKYHLVGHSHGGSVVWEALCIAAGRLGSEPRRGLKTWTTVGTPYLYFVPDLTSLWSLVTLAGALGILYWQYRWFINFWKELRSDISAPWWWKAIAVQIPYAVLFILLALFLHLLFRIFVLQEAQDDTRDKSDAPRIELGRLGMAVIALLIPTLIIAAAVWSLDVGNKLYPLIWTAFTLPVLGVSLYLWIAGLTIVISASNLIVLLVQVFRSSDRKHSAEDAWEKFANKNYCLTSLDHDEALAGLRAIVHGIKGPLLPRMVAPGDGTYSRDTGRLTAPEQRGDSWSNYLLMSLNILRDWLLRPIYNEIFAKLIDDFVLRRLTRTAQGTDIPGLRLGRVDCFPVAPSVAAGHCSRIRDAWTWRFIPLVKPALNPEQRLVGLTVAEANSICDATNQSAPGLLRQIRGALGVLSPLSASLTNFFRQAMTGDPGTHVPPMNLLVHTQYFEQSTVINLIRACITGTAVVQPVRHCRTNRTVPSPEPLSSHDLAGRFFSTSARFAVFVLFLLLPAILTAVLGLNLVYPYSRDFHLRWAAEVPQAIAAAAPRIDNFGSYQDPHSPNFVRWFAALDAVGRHQDASAFEAAFRSLGAEPKRFVDFYSLASEKLAELGELEAADKMLDRISKELRFTVAKTAPYAIDRLDKATENLKRARAGQPIVLEQPEMNALTPFPASLALAQRLTGKSALSPADLPTSAEFTGATQETKAQSEPRRILNAIYLFLIIHERLLQTGHYPEAAQWFALAEKLADHQETLCMADTDASSKLAIESLILLAKSKRWPEAIQQDALRLLARAHACALHERQPLNKLESLARVAAGYARLGLFSHSSELAKEADAQSRLLVAKEMLANEYERTEISRLGGDLAATYHRLADIRHALDEQIDLRRGGYDNVAR